MSDKQPKTTAARLEELEISVAHQQRLLEQLNEVLVTHSQAMLKLEKTIPKLEAEIKELRQVAASKTESLPDEKPPHY